MLALVSSSTSTRLAGAGCLGFGKSLLQKRTGEAGGQQAQDRAAQSQQQQMFQPAAAGQPWRRRQKEHQRAEDGPLFDAAADQMEDHRQSDRQRSQQGTMAQESSCRRRGWQPVNPANPPPALHPGAEELKQGEFQRPVRGQLVHRPCRGARKRSAGSRSATAACGDTPFARSRGQ